MLTGILGFRNHLLGAQQESQATPASCTRGEPPWAAMPKASSCASWLEKHALTATEETARAGAGEILGAQGARGECSEGRGRGWGTLSSLHRAMPLSDPAQLDGQAEKQHSAVVAEMVAGGAEAEVSACEAQVPVVPEHWQVLSQ